LGGILTSEDFYSLSGFRYQTLCAREQTYRITEINRFLADTGLTFRAMAVAPAVRAAFERQVPQVRWPGTLEDWDAFEQQYPRTFDGMYTFWCSTI
jgi:hypothetical protein